MRIICCRFGNKFTQWHIDNLKHMIDEYSGLKYDSFEVIEDDLYGNWFNKFQMYDRFRDGENLYFDLDLVIYDKLPNLVRKDFTLLDDTWWREPAHTPLNSSIVSWTGDVSHIWDRFKATDEAFIKDLQKVVMNGIINLLIIKLMIKFVLQLKIIYINNHLNLAYVL